MSGSNAAILKRALEHFRDEKVDSMQFWMTGLCEKTVEEAVKARMYMGRNMTGNLINSIACALYRDGHLVHASYSRDEVSEPVHKKMTAPRVYTFSPAWDVGKVIRYAAEIETDQGHGGQDAFKFVQSYKPDGNALLQMVLAYTTEYATFVEAKRGTTGYFQTMEFVSIEAPKILNAKL